MIDAIGPGTAEDTLRAAGHEPLSIEALLARILGHTAWGDYQYGYRFVSYCDQDGTVEGTNNVGSYNTGRWEIDQNSGTLNFSWNQSWVPASLYAYDVGGVLHLFNQHTGLWHMNFDKFILGKQPLEVWS